ncbi:TIM-barrel domain-containing protein [uncultured Sphaerochaeta sp.]|uniref:glycoside hydrolase family 31 protein n=1 Tax=uncultured Sphaerochaeta sp. TaxID=886478 RepID=UPI002A0A1A21|nr:TIM-barrel domain-containing protein [uncultured Sphaerochaeta sp.]
MKQKNRFIFDMLDQDSPDAQKDSIFRAGKPQSVREEAGATVVSVPFHKQEMKNMFLYPAQPARLEVSDMIVRCYGDSILRCTTAFGGSIPKDEDNPMFSWDPTLVQGKICPEKTDEGWDLKDGNGKVKMRIHTKDFPREIWSTLQPEPPETFDAVVFPDDKVAVPFMAYDDFFPAQSESFSLGYVKRDEKVHRCLYSLHAEQNEKFAGTGERFSKMDLAGKTYVLENTDGLGVNSRRSYKNVPFYISSKGYGLLIMTSAHVRLSLADISTRAAQALVEDDVLDLFFIGGGNAERILWNYRRITGFPANVPFWSYGTWMSRMSYFSAEETRNVVKKMREGKFPCDVIHIDTGWFKKDWKCEWEFNPEKFPEPETYLKEMEDQGIKISLWQLPCIAKDTMYYGIANENRYVAPKSEHVALGSNFSAVEFDGNIDFSNPEAVLWYQGLLKKLLDMGVAVIKTDFGEVIEENAAYLGMSYRKLHNVYALLYQKAAHEISRQVKGPSQAMIWARAGWIGCQRYPIHWGGDCACSWDGMAGSLRGGLHLGISGFAFWSHDVPGFQGIPSFMNSRPSDDLYIRWTQMGVFSSHLRYHGTTPREPYEYPAVSDIARKWLNLRYALIPYLAEQGNKAIQTGFPLVRALLFDHFDDATCWSIDDEFYCGDSLLVAPVMNGTGIRDVYLPSGLWVDFWSGESITGGLWLKNVASPLELLPVYVKKDSVIPVYPQIVQCTKEMDLSKIQEIRFDDTYRGFSASILGKSIALGI